VTDTLKQDPDVARWGGLAGIAGSILLIGVFVLVGVLVGADPAEPAGFLTRFPDVRTAHIVENTLYLAAIALWTVHILALHQTLRSHRPAPALFGSALAILGLVVLAAGSLPHLWQTPISDLYHAAGTTVDEQAALVVMWQAAQGIFSALLVTGLLLIPAGYLALGMAMRSTPGLGATVGHLVIGLGAVGLAAATVVLIEDSIVAALAVFAVIAFHLVVGWKTYRLSSLP
jgi:hypothetical protein